MLTEIISRKQNGGRPIAAFIDLKAAYNRVDLGKLYHVMEAKQILPTKLLDLLKFLHANITVTYGTERCSTTTGVPQGLTTSPACFNIYVESLI
jgi:hypothetical protein